MDKCISDKCRKRRKGGRREKGREVEEGRWGMEGVRKEGRKERIGCNLNISLL